MNATLQKVLVVVIVALLAGVVIFAIANTPNKPKSLNTAATAEATPSPSPVAVTIDEKAAVWVTMLLANFEEPGENIDACVDYTPAVDLTEVHYYFEERNKESDSAFGPDFGSTPCEVSINLVERLYRDPMLLADKAVEWGVEGADNSPEGVAALAKAPFEERERLADIIIGYYAAEEYVLKIEQRDEAYVSRGASSNGEVPSTGESEADKSSSVLVTYDEESGDKVKEDRLDCGLQGYTPKPPCVTNCTPPCPPGKPINPDGTCPKDASQDVNVNPAVDDWKKDDVASGNEPGHPVNNNNGATDSQGLQTDPAADAAAAKAAADAANAADAAAAQAAVDAATVVDPSQTHETASPPPSDW